MLVSTRVCVCVCVCACVRVYVGMVVWQNAEGGRCVLLVNMRVRVRVYVFGGWLWGRIAVEDTSRYSTRLFTDEVVRIIDAHDVFTPLFMYLVYRAVHAPDETPQSHIDIYKDLCLVMERP